MQIKLLKDIVSSIVGPVGSKIVDLLYNQKNVNEFLIAKKLNLTINQTRNVLYRLSDEGLVSFIRKKDNKKGGWYTYFWTLNSGKSFTKFKSTLLKNIVDLKDKLEKRKHGRYFVCTNCHIEYDEENALLNSYTCPECGEALLLKDNVEEVKQTERDIAKLESILAEVDTEIGIIENLEQKARDRKQKAIQKKKTKERLERKKERDKLKKKEQKAKPKKKSKKKK